MQPDISAASAAPATILDAVRSERVECIGVVDRIVVLVYVGK
jgi:hypothetical protein